MIDVNVRARKRGWNTIAPPRKELEKTTHGVEPANVEAVNGKLTFLSVCKVHCNLQLKRLEHWHNFSVKPQFNLTTRITVKRHALAEHLIKKYYK
jgi:hypothetical protein